MTVGIHQPNFLPWIGYFYKIASCDSFVFLDDAQYSKNSFINRNKIKVGNEAKWLTCPVATSGLFGQTINEVRIIQPEVTSKYILGTLYSNYHKTPCFKKYFELLSTELNMQGTLADLNISLIKMILKDFEIHTVLIRSSELKGIEGNATERLISICHNLGGDIYLAGFGAVKYQEDELFRKADIQLRSTDFVHPVYMQSGDGFIPNLSIIDYLFNMGNTPFK